MPLSQHIASVAKGLEFNLVVFGEGEWDPKIRERLIGESVDLLDELLLDPVFAYTLQIAYDAKVSDANPFQPYVVDGAPLLNFLNAEKELLEGAGLPGDYVERLIEETRKAVEQGLTGLVPPNEVFQAVVRLKFALLKAAQSKAPQWPKAARGLAVSLGGAALVTLNATGWAMSIGIAGPLAALSAAAGGAILGEGAKDVLGLLPG